MARTVGLQAGDSSPEQEASSSSSPRAREAGRAWLASQLGRREKRHGCQLLSITSSHLLVSEGKGTQAVDYTDSDRSGPTPPFEVCRAVLTPLAMDMTLEEGDSVIKQGRRGRGQGTTAVG